MEGCPRRRRRGHLGQRGSRAAIMKRRPADSGSSPVRSRKAIGICRRRRTPSFCRSTSQCAFAVLGEIPRRIPTSSFEQPAAINATTSRCLNVMGAVFLSVASSIMAPKLLPRSRDGHWLGGVRRGVTLLRAIREAVSETQASRRMLRLPRGQPDPRAPGVMPRAAVHERPSRPSRRLRSPARPGGSRRTPRRRGTPGQPGEAAGGSRRCSSPRLTARILPVGRVRG